MTTNAQAAQSETRSAEGQAEIDVAPEVVWEAITNARELERWFPLDARVEPGEGGSIWMSWRNEFASTMKILAWDPPRHLRTSWGFHELEGPGQITDYMIEGKGGKTVIRAVTSGFPLDSSWDGWVEGTNRGWAFELGALKYYLENHRGKDRHVAYKRLRVLLEPAESWSRLKGDSEAAAWLSAGRAYDNVVASQYAAALDNAVMRISVEPGAPGGPSEIVFWLSVWGGDDASARAAESGNEWSGLLSRLFPEGSAP